MLRNAGLADSRKCSCCPRDTLRGHRVPGIRLRSLVLPAMFVALSFTGDGLAARIDAGRDYPSKPIRLIVPFAPGGGTDIMARALAQKLTERLGKPLVVDNRPGAAGNIGVELAARAAADGYTLTMISTSHAVNPALRAKLPYDLLRDLAPVTQLTVQTYVLVVHPGLPASSVDQLVALSKRRSGGLAYGSSGAGALNHLSGALFAMASGARLLHVPYKGGAPALTDVLGGQIDMMFSTLLQASSHLKAGRLRALAVTMRKRSRALPDLPTMTEAGVRGYEVEQWYGVLSSSGVRKTIVEKVRAEIVGVLRSAEFGERLAIDGLEAIGSAPEEFRAYLATEVAKWKKLVKEANIRAE